jgi:alpha-methylacyl-CoA racemase
MGPLAGLRIIEMAGIGPGPLCAMLLADMGAEVIRIDRLASGEKVLPIPTELDIVNRGRTPIAIDLKQASGRALLLRLIGGADGLIEGFRPGVAERLGIGPADCHAVNPRLVYGRMTGWGQDGPLAQAAGHDINYIALTGALAATGRAGAPPTPPLNLVGDYGGGTMFLAFGMVCALLERERSGKGQVVDAAMVDGAAILMTTFYSMRAAGLWGGGRGGNLLDSGAPFYDVYPTSDGKWVSVGALENRFFAELAERIGLDRRFVDRQHDRALWPELRAHLGEIFAARTRDEWAALLEGTDACVAGVLDLDEAPLHPHNAARGTFRPESGAWHPAPAPRFSRSRPEAPAAPTPPGDPAEVLRGFGVAESEIAALRAEGVIG